MLTFHLCKCACRPGCTERNLWRPRLAESAARSGACPLSRAATPRWGTFWTTTEQCSSSKQLVGERTLENMLCSFLFCQHFWFVCSCCACSNFPREINVLCCYRVHGLLFLAVGKLSEMMLAASAACRNCLLSASAGQLRLSFTAIQLPLCRRNSTVPFSDQIVSAFSESSAASVMDLTFGDGHHSKLLLGNYSFSGLGLQYILTNELRVY